MSFLGLATKKDLDQLERKIMSAISEYEAKVTAHLDKVDLAVAGVAGDVAFLKKTIEDLQNSPGTITPEDQALLDAAEARIGGIAAKLEALDSETPPAPPTA